jgi:hypothetical protein
MQGEIASERSHKPFFAGAIPAPATIFAEVDP